MKQFAKVVRQSKNFPRKPLSIYLSALLGSGSLILAGCSNDGGSSAPSTVAVDSSVPSVMQEGQIAQGSVALLSTSSSLTSVDSTDTRQITISDTSSCSPKLTFNPSSLGVTVDGDTELFDITALGGNCLHEVTFSGTGVSTSSNTSDVNVITDQAVVTVALSSATVEQGGTFSITFTPPDNWEGVTAEQTYQVAIDAEGIGFNKATCVLNPSTDNGCTITVTVAEEVEAGDYTIAVAQAEGTGVPVDKNSLDFTVEPIEAEFVTASTNSNSYITTVGGTVPIQVFFETTIEGETATDLVIDMSEFSPDNFNYDPDDAGCDVVGYGDDKCTYSFLFTPSEVIEGSSISANYEYLDNAGQPQNGTFTINVEAIAEPVPQNGLSISTNVINGTTEVILTNVSDGSITINSFSFSDDANLILTQDGCSGEIIGVDNTCVFTIASLIAENTGTPDLIINATPDGGEVFSSTFLLSVKVTSSIIYSLVEAKYVIIRSTWTQDNHNDGKLTIYNTDTIYDGDSVGYDQDENVPDDDPIMSWTCDPFNIRKQDSFLIQASNLEVHVPEFNGIASFLFAESWFNAPVPADKNVTVSIETYPDGTVIEDQQCSWVADQPPLKVFSTGGYVLTNNPTYTSFGTITCNFQENICFYQ